jgi:hypothetical protein
MTLSLAFLAPPLVTAAIEGRLSRGFGARDGSHGVCSDAMRPDWTRRHLYLGNGILRAKTGAPILTHGRQGAPN